MRKFIVDYDLLTPGKDYSSLIDAIKQYPWAKICKSSWAIKSDSAASDIRDNLKKHIDSNDRLFVAALTGDWASYNLPNDVVDWLKAE